MSDLYSSIGIYSSEKIDRAVLYNPDAVAHGLEMKKDMNVIHFYGIV